MLYGHSTHLYIENLPLIMYNYIAVHVYNVPSFIVNLVKQKLHSANNIQFGPQFQVIMVWQGNLILCHVNLASNIPTLGHVPLDIHRHHLDVVIKRCNILVQLGAWRRRYSAVTTALLISHLTACVGTRCDYCASSCRFEIKKRKKWSLWRSGVH